MGVILTLCHSLGGLAATVVANMILAIGRVLCVSVLSLALRRSGVLVGCVNATLIAPHTAGMRGTLRTITGKLGERREAQGSQQWMS